MNCIACHKFYGTKEKNNLCSQCYAIVNHIEPAQLTFTNTLLHSTVAKECNVCIENKYDSGIYSCICSVYICDTCASQIKKCPGCRACSLIPLTKNDVSNLVDFFNLNYINPSDGVNVFRNLLRNHKNKVSGVVTLSSFITTGLLIAQVVHEKRNIIGNMHNVLYAMSAFLIFDLSLDDCLTEKGLPTFDGCLTHTVNYCYPNYKKTTR